MGGARPWAPPPPPRPPPSAALATRARRVGRSLPSCDTAGRRQKRWSPQLRRGTPPQPPAAPAARKLAGLPAPALRRRPRRRPVRRPSRVRRAGDSTGSLTSRIATLMRRRRRVVRSCRRRRRRQWRWLRGRRQRQAMWRRCGCRRPAPGPARQLRVGDPLPARPLPPGTAPEPRPALQPQLRQRRRLWAGPTGPTPQPL